MAKVKTSKENTQYVMPLGNGWTVKGVLDKEFFLITAYQSEALSVARSIAKNIGSKVIIYNKKGIIRATESYTRTLPKIPAAPKRTAERKPVR